MRFLGFCIVICGFALGALGALNDSGKAQIAAALVICLGLLICIFG